jgi:hypothetical protein
MDMGVVSIEIPIAGGHAQHLLLNLGHQHVRLYPDVFDIDHGLLGDVVSVDYTLQMKGD